MAAAGGRWPCIVEQADWEPPQWHTRDSLLSARSSGVGWCHNSSSPSFPWRADLPARGQWRRRRWCDAIAPELSPAEQADAAACIPASHTPPHLLAKYPLSVRAAAPLPLRPSPSLPSVSPQHNDAAPPRDLPCRCARRRPIYSPSVSTTARQRSELWAAWAPVRVGLFRARPARNRPAGPGLGRWCSLWAASARHGGT
jgi:hypothetical protein